VWWITKWGFLNKRSTSAINWSMKMILWSISPTCLLTAFMQTESKAQKDSPVISILLRFWGSVCPKAVHKSLQIISELFSELKFPNFFSNFFAKIPRVRKFRFFPKNFRTHWWDNDGIAIKVLYYLLRHLQVSLFFSGVVVCQNMVQCTYYCIIIQCKISGWKPLPCIV